MQINGGDSDLADNRDEIAYWNGPAAKRWIAGQELLDQRLEPFAHAVIDRASVRPGGRIVDIGCGCGATTLLLADRVGPGGEVVGLDVSAPMLARARQRAQSLRQVRFVEGDASTYPLGTGFDLLFSRFGVMFFARPGPSFANLRRALGESGRLAFVCWQPLAANPWMAVPLAAARSAAQADAAPSAAAAPTDRDAPGPFSLGDPARLRRVLAEGGFAAVEVESYTQPILLGATVDDATSFALENGPVARIIEGADEATRARVAAAVQEALAKEVGPAGSVVLPSATWMVTARG